MDTGVAEAAGTKWNRPRVNLRRSLRDAIEEMRLIESGLRRYVEKAERLLWELYSIEQAERERDCSLARRAPRRAVGGPAPAGHDWQLEELPDGRAAVRIDTEKPLTLTATLAALATILAAAEGPSCDELVAWKSLDRIGDLMEKRLGRVFDRHAVSQLLWRLRVKFGAAGMDPRLVESAPPLGARLRLKRRSAGVCAG
jgi:hypothetical protein